MRGIANLLEQNGASLNLLVRALSYADHGDDCSHTDENAKCCQERTQFV